MTATGPGRRDGALRRLALAALARLPRIRRVHAVERICRRLARGRWFPEPVPPVLAGPGISVIVPERGTPELLEECLRSAVAALAAVDEPGEVIVVVNGIAFDGYRDLAARWPEVRWVHVEECIWYEGAVREGVARAAHDWVYLLNSDMVVDRRGLAELLPWRAPHVFGIASQIFFVDPARRREETGWTDLAVRDGIVDLFDVPPDDGETVRGTLYAGGGASLFRKALLARYLDRPSPYRPFYWEDVEWGVRAWRSGYESLFCPRSHVRHHHRATNRRFFAEAEIERIFERNRCLFQLRNPLPGESFRALAAQLLALPRRTIAEVLAPGTLWGALQARLRSYVAPLAADSLLDARARYFLSPLRQGDEQPVVLVVSPYGVYPPAHGGAVRLRQLLDHLAGLHQIVLLSDEGATYTGASTPYFAPLAAVHLVSGRADRTRPDDRVGRIREHSRARLAEALEALIARYRPEIVQVEYVELVQLVERRRPGLAWLLTLHDVLLDAAGRSPADRFELGLIERFDGVIACSAEDAALLAGAAPALAARGAVALVPNGATVAPARYRPSPDRPRILFVGSLRHRPNLDGIAAFLDRALPAIRARVPAAELCIVGGHGARALVADRPAFGEPGVEVCDFVEDVRPLLDACALTVNPIPQTRGSCIKVLESLAAGRVCASTRAGARGFLGPEIPGLVVAEGVDDLATMVAGLLLDRERRHVLERAALDAVESRSWARSAELLAAVYRRHAGRARAVDVPVSALAATKA